MAASLLTNMVGSLETVIVTSKCHCAMKEGERNFLLFTFVEILRVGIVAAVRSWEKIKKKTAL